MAAAAFGSSLGRRPSVCCRRWSSASSSSGKTEAVVKQQLINNGADLDFKESEDETVNCTSIRLGERRAADGEVFLTLHRVLQTARGAEEQ